MSRKKMNKFEKESQVRRVSDQLGITPQLAKELLILAKSDEDLVVESYYSSAGLGECKVKIIDSRLSEVEE